MLRDVRDVQLDYHLVFVKVMIGSEEEEVSAVVRFGRLRDEECGDGAERVPVLHLFVSFEATPSNGNEPYCTKKLDLTLDLSV